jgi:ATP/maltotriose-dependent transcriptional regulator MalT
MALPVLVMKLFIPRPRPNVVFRARLIVLLNEGLSRTLSLICAPAGFGKTTSALPHHLRARPPRGVNATIKEEVREGAEPSLTS